MECDAALLQAVGYPEERALVGDAEDDSVGARQWEGISRFASCVSHLRAKDASRQVRAGDYKVRGRRLTVEA